MGGAATCGRSIDKGQEVGGVFLGGGRHGGDVAGR